MKRIITKMTLIFAAIALLSLCESSVSAYERNYYGDLDYNENLIPRQPSLKPPLYYRNPESPKRYRDYPADKTYSSKYRKFYEETPSRSKYSQPRLEKIKEPETATVEPVPVRDEKVILEHDEPNAAEVFKNAAEISEPTPESNIEIPHVDADEEKFALHPVNFQRTESEEAFVERYGRNDEPGKKLLFTLQVPSPEHPGVPETFVCQPLPPTESIDLMAPSLPFIQSDVPLRSEPFLGPDYYAPETPAETEFRSSLKHNMDHLDHEPVRYMSDQRVLNDVVSKLKTAVMTFEDQLNNGYYQSAESESNKGHEEKITRKFLNFIQRYLGLYEPKDSQTTYVQPFVSGPNPEVYAKSLPCPPATEEILSLPPQAYLPPSAVAGDTFGIPGVVYPPTVGEIPAPIPQTHFSTPEVINQPQNMLSAPGFFVPQAPAAPTFTYPEAPKSTVVHSGFPSSEFNQYQAPATNDLPKTQPIMPQMITPTELTKYFPTVTSPSSASPVSSVVSQTQTPGESVLNSGFDGTKWVAATPQNNQFPSYENGGNGFHKWTVSSPSAQKPNVFSVTDYYPIQIPNIEPGMRVNIKTPSPHYNIPDFDHGASEEVLIETTTFPSVRSADETEPPVNDRRQKVKTPRQKSAKQRKEPSKAVPLDTYVAEHDITPVVTHSGSPQYIPEPMMPTQHEALPIHNQPMHAYPMYLESKFQALPAHNLESSTIVRNPGTYSHNVGVPESHQHTFSVGGVPTDGQIYPPLGSAHVSVQRLEPAKFVIKHEEPYVLNYQSSPYIVDVMRSPSVRK